jgi:hypothetical protein
MLIVSVQGSKRRGIRKGSECKSISVNKHRVDVEHLRSNTQACTTNEAGELDYPTLKLLENTWIFRVNICIDDIDS